MPLEDIKKLPIIDLAEDNCILFIWVTFPMLQEGLEVIKAWGFKYKTCAFNWIKTNDDGTPFFGIGHYTKSNSELCLLAVKGRLEVKSNKVSQIILSKKSKHSRKPHIVYSKIEEILPYNSRIELFARNKRQGWDAWGNQVPKEEQKLITLVEVDNG